MVRLEGDERTGPLSRREKITLVIALVLVGGLAGYFINDRFDDSRLMNPPSPNTETTTVQQKWGCEPDEIVLFGETVTCISEEEHVSRR